MPVPILSDGTPLTFEWLNQLADTINRIEALNADDSNVKFVGKISGEDIQVVTGSESLQIAKDTNQVTKDNILFPVRFLDNNVVVVAMGTSVAEDGVPIPAAVAVGDVSDTGFDAIIKLVATKANALKTVDLRYVAIGKKSSTL